MSLSKYADVVVDIELEKLDKPFTYRIPEDIVTLVKTGTPVDIPFGAGNKTRKGYVINIKDEAGVKFDINKIKDIKGIAKKQVGLEEEFLELASWMKDRYGCTFAKALKTVLPVKKVVKKQSGKADAVEDNRRPYQLHKPNEEQQACLDEFEGEYSSGNMHTYLIHGITGSGKTDLYMHMIKYVVDLGRKVILLIPEIGLTYQTIDRLYSAFGSRIAIIHSKLSPGERYEQIRKCLDGEADIIIGPRSAVFAPFKNIGLIVIDEEHDGAYKNETIPRYNTVDVAAHRALMHNASVVLASATPSPDSYNNALTGRYRLLKLTRRAAGAIVPSIEVIDMRDEMNLGNRSIFSYRLRELIDDRLSKKEQVILFMNRRGYSTFVSCRSCGNAIRCPHCDVSLTLHRGNKLKCHYCGYEKPMPKVCPTCGSTYIAQFGTGTQKLEVMTRKMFPDARVARLDTDSAAGKTASENILRDMANAKIDILIGTQMVVKGHDYPNVTLVGIMAADTSLYVSNYDSGEKTFELIAQAAGRAGRGSKPGCVVIQTYKPEHYAIKAASENSFADYYKNEMAFRKLMHYPPSFHIWTVQLSSKNEEELLRHCDIFCACVKKFSDKAKAEMIGPVEPQVYKVNDYFRKLIYVKHSSYEMLLSIKDDAEKDYEKLMGENEISVLYDFT